MKVVTVGAVLAGALLVIVGVVVLTLTSPEDAYADTRHDLSGLEPTQPAGQDDYSFDVEPTPEERAALERIRGKIPGYIVFESNRGGRWNLYGMRADGTGLTRLTDVERHRRVNDPLYATISHDGKILAWQHHPDNKVGRKKGFVWLMNPDGSNERPLYEREVTEEESERPYFLPDGRLKFVRDGDGTNQRVMVYDFKKESPKRNLVDRIFSDPPELPKGHESWQEELIFDNDVSKDNDKGYLKPERVLLHTITEDFETMVAWGKYADEIPRGTWVFTDFEDGNYQTQYPVQGGCSPRLMPDGKNFVWVLIAGTFGIGSWEGGLQTEVLFDGPHHPVFSHGYFPFVTPDYKYLVYGACPENQHDHNTANYQILIAELDEELKPIGDPVRLTFSRATDRYPIMHYEGMYDADTRVPQVKGQAHLEVQGPGDFDKEG